MRFNALIFDLDDTLYKEYEYVHSGFRAVADFITAKDEKINRDQIYEETVSLWKKFGRGKTFDLLCKKHGLNIEVTKLVDVYRTHLPSIKLYPDANRFLHWLKSKKIKTGIITDGHRTTQWRKIEALRLQSMVDHIIVTDDLGLNCWKPSEIPYCKIIELLNVDFNESVYIGDNPHKDFITAKRLGMKTVRIIRPVGDHMKTMLSAEYEADLNITKLTDLIPKLT